MRKCKKTVNVVVIETLALGGFRGHRKSNLMSFDLIYVSAPYQISGGKHDLKSSRVD